MATCPDNSTECLLQKVVAALDKANSAYNWGPAAFAVTLVIGIIALWFALIPVFQGILFPLDRVKYGRYAIGRWNELVKLKWDWANMNYTAITQTPILDFHEIAYDLEHVDRRFDGVKLARPLPKYARNFFSGDVEASPGGTFCTRQLSRARRDIKAWKLNCSAEAESFQIPNVIHTYYTGMHEIRNWADRPEVAAGWLSLLRHLGIENQIYEMRRIRKSLAIMIPGDVPAAVAYVSVESAVLFAAVVGCKTIVIDGKYPSARGRGLQLDFRDHPLLGTVAAFANYGTDQLEILTRKTDIIAASRHYRGLLQIGGFTLDQPVESWNPAEIKHFGIVREYSWPNLLVNHAIDPFQTEDKSRRSRTVNGVWLLYGDIPWIVKVFPSASLEVHAIATAIVCQSLVWEDFNRSDFSWAAFPLPSCTRYEVKQSSSLFDEAGHFRLQQRYSRQLSFETWFAHANVRPDRPDTPDNAQDVDLHQAPDSTTKPSGHSIIIVEGSEEACRAWLLDPKEFRRMTANDDTLRKIIVLQLLEIDYWLSMNRRLVAPIARSIFERASSLHFISRRLKKLSVDEFPVKAIHLSSLHVLNHSDINEDMLVRNESYRDIVEAFNRGSPDDWMTGRLGWIASGQQERNFNPVPWLRKYRNAGQYGHDEEEKWEGRELGKTWTQIYEDEQRSFLEKNKIRIITTEERQGPAEGIIEAESACLTWEEYEGIKVYLVFRALLFGTLLDTGADNSCLLNLDHAKQVVPML